MAIRIEAGVIWSEVEGKAVPLATEDIYIRVGDGQVFVGGDQRDLRRHLARLRPHEVAMVTHWLDNREIIPMSSRESLMGDVIGACAMGADQLHIRSGNQFFEPGSRALAQFQFLVASRFVSLRSVEADQASAFSLADYLYGIAIRDGKALTGNRAFLDK